VNYILHVTCKVNKEFIEFLERDYFRTFSFENFRWLDDEHSQLLENMPKRFQDLINIWLGLDICNRFQEYSFINDEFNCSICKKVTSHDGDLMNDYMSFLKDIIVPLSDKITYCKIESDDYGDHVSYYSDSELRGIYFRLCDKVKKVIHTYNEDNTEIIESRVIYKHSIKDHQLIDLNRVYGV
jgi:hypothetical protein